MIYLICLLGVFATPVITIKEININVDATEIYEAISGMPIFAGEVLASSSPLLMGLIIRGKHFFKSSPYYFYK